MSARAGLVCILLATLPVSVRAQAEREGFALDSQGPPPTIEDGLRLEVPSTLGAGRWSAQLVVDYAHAPLVISEQSTGDEVGAVVAHRLVSHLSFAAGVGDRVQLHAGVPVAIMQSGDAPSAMGETFEDPVAPAVGDPVVGGSVRLTGDELLGPAVALAASLRLPVGSEAGLVSDGSIGAKAAVVGAFVTEDVTPLLSIGVDVRPSRTYLSAEIGTALTFGAGAHVHLAPVELMVEIAGATTFAQAFAREGTTLEALLGGRYFHESGLAVGAGVGLGLADAVGVPDLRALLTLGFAPGREPAEREVPAPADEDVVMRPAPDVATTFAEEPDLDTDSDGIPDGSDACADEPETDNGLEDDDGCPEPVEVTDTHIVVEPAVRFERRSSDIEPGELERLRVVADLLRARDDLVLVQIEGHAARDDGARRRALALSERRAVAVVRFLVEQGVAEERLIAVGLGSAQPASTGSPDDDRRVTFRIVEQR